MANKILLLGRKGILVENAQAHIGDSDLTIITGTNIEDVRCAFDQYPDINHVFVGAGIELDQRLEIVREVFNRSSTSTVHLKDASSGPQGFLPFVKAILQGLNNGVKHSDKT